MRYMNCVASLIGLIPVEMKCARTIYIAPVVVEQHTMQDQLLRLGRSPLTGDIWHQIRHVAEVRN